MKKIFILSTLCLLGLHAFAQNTFEAVIRNKKNNETLIGASAIIKGTTYGSVSDFEGKLKIQNVPNGNFIIIFSFLGFEEERRSYTFPLIQTKPEVILLEPSENKLEEVVVVSSTRSSRTIKDLPTRIEVIAAEELNEKANMYPGNISMLLKESTGIQVQQTSAVSASSSFRLQGLPGRYTQLLKDGFPLYSGFSSGLSLMQIPPLDLKQVEIIKGSASTLYGGGAISGLVNLISKKPEEERELTFFINGTSARGLDLNSYYSKKFRKVGMTFYGTYNGQKAYDPAGINFSAIPNQTRFNINPRIFYYINDSTTISLGINYGNEHRLGGNMKYINGKGDSLNSYFEKNYSERLSTQLKFEKKYKDGAMIVFKNSLNRFFRNIRLPNYEFQGIQLGSYSELSYAINRGKNEIIGGLNLWTDNFSEKRINSKQLRSYNQSTVGGFAQNTFKASEAISLESGVRVDYSNLTTPYSKINQFFFLPRISALFKINKNLTSRFGGGLGYKMPSIFNEEAEELSYKNFRNINLREVKPENSIGGNLDFYYKTILFDELILSVNELFFYTRLDM